MIHTGFLDKDGREILEDDVVLVKDGAFENKMWVGWNERMSCWSRWNIGDDENEPYQYLDQLGEMTVIGRKDSYYG